MLWIIAALVLYVIWRRFRLTDLEFAIIAFSLLILIAHTLPSQQQEHFEEAPDAPEDTMARKLQTLIELPGYIKSKIGGQLDGLVKDAKNTSSSNDDVISKETQTEDPDVASDSKVDDAKFALLKREYITADLMFKNLKESNPDAYTRAFGADSDLSQEEQETNAQMQPAAD